jgi:hypothetical protein
VSALQTDKVAVLLEDLAMTAMTAVSSRRRLPEHRPRGRIAQRSDPACHLFAILKRSPGCREISIVI